jgi:hypothetical protein
MEPQSAPLTTIAVCLFAEGDAATFFAAAAALDAAADGLSCRLIVYDCGLDVWASLALEAYADAAGRVERRKVPNADKAAAWNDYVFARAGEASAHIFLDGDAAPTPGAFRALAEALAAAPDAYGAAALSSSGRSRRAWARQTIIGHGLNRQLYAVSNAFIADARAAQARMPFGLVGVDGLVAYLMHTDFGAAPEACAPHRLIVAEDAFFRFRALKLNRRDFHRWRVREARAARRRLESQALYARLKRGGLAAMPLTVSELFRQSDLAGLKSRRDPVGAWFGRAARAALYRAFADRPSNTTRPAR